MSDASDVVLAADGDYQAFERLFRRYVIRIYSLCTRLSGTRRQGEKLTREVFVRAWQRLPELTSETAFGTWIPRLAIDMALNAKANGVTPDGRRVGWADQRSDAAEVPEQPAGLDLSGAIDTLSEDHRRIFVLHDVERYQHEEIAEIFGITVGRSKAHLRRARRLLLEAVDR